MTAITAPDLSLADIARDIGLDSNQIEAWVTQANPFSDGSGYTLHLRLDTPADVLALLPGSDKAGRFVVAYEDSLVRQRRRG
ncbi:hypothetical protein SAMN05216588_10487 [Pseudomonas flavescens]|uniref:Uncharacterized protein n=1 Tax=Phytopseudomonas flavescens TaxID=29435 RepID=A0A1G8BM15_9GAMM|nr:hypothetical protein [Pseudomonas flavescens]SDH34104.1 hypothetical protein SAMN05216588_10487 [Pseudomonas flavescens]